MSFMDFMVDHSSPFAGFWILGGREMARPAGLEPTTLCLEGRCSIQLSYGRNHGNITGVTMPAQAGDWRAKMKTRHRSSLC